MDLSELCVICGKRVTTACTGCVTILYCSADCLNSDKAHGLACKCFQALPTAPTTGNKHVLAYLFPADTTEPKVMWVPVSGFADADTGISFEEADTSQFFPSPTSQTLNAERNNVRNRESNSMLEIWHTSTGSGNACIESLAGIQGGQGPFHDWVGHVLVLAMTRPTGFMVDPGAYRSVQLRDFQDAVDFVVDFGNTAHRQLTQETLNTLGLPLGTTGSVGGSMRMEEKETGNIIAEIE
ncbi:hypothetical protein QBC34DRAFT_102930 [Podospora aff. communis PSN243]|uniref:MYND-type domain-containing protein n=1 Tax=Podospora aff. communis PSN243 TaxID=3040156 RepID=A0AAV9GKE2_9PEZI|nr:hypothetical protein QBC34DRAFT_102930 [Podospora aff. communis PSN243]